MSWHSRTLPGLARGSRTRRRLMLQTGSLSRSLGRLCADGFRVELLRAHCTRPMREEAVTLRLPAGTRAWVREVLLKCHDKNLVYARTVVPLPSLAGGNRCLRRLRQRPLGGVLFRAADGGRKWVQYGFQDAAHPAWAGLPAAVRPRAERARLLWGRRSLFELNRKPLLVTEFFLPAINHLPC